MTEKEYKQKREEISKTHPDRLVTKCLKIEDVRTMIAEGISKGYTILNADDIDFGLEGLVLFRQIDGVELAYNPRWEYGKLGITTSQLLKEFGIPVPES